MRDAEAVNTVRSQGVTSTGGRDRIAAAGLTPAHPATAPVPAWAWAAVDRVRRSAAGGVVPRLGERDGSRRVH